MGNILLLKIVRVNVLGGQNQHLSSTLSQMFFFFFNKVSLGVLSLQFTNSHISL